MSIQRAMRRHIKRQEKEAEEAKPPKPIGWMGRTVNRVFATLPEPVRRRIVLAKYSLTKPAPNPAQIGKVDPKYYRPITLELPFRIHPDGKIDYINRWGNDIRITNPDVIKMVQHEYGSLVAEAKRQGAFD